jgi:serine/threonine protein phosphatase PrpC
MMISMKIDLAADTHVGKKRVNNEDTFLTLLPMPTATLPIEAVFLAADGMGGHQRGEVASGAVRDIFAEVFSEQYETFLEMYAIADREELLHKLIQEIHNNLHEMAQSLAQEGEQREMMGTTLTTALVAENQLFLGHVGDSRAYLVRGDGLAPLTEDHTMAALMVKAGKMTEEEAAVSKYRNALSQAIGASKKVRPDVFSFPLEDGDRLLLCTDGLTRHVSDDEIGDILMHQTPQAACQALIDLANSRGGRDNITAVVAHFSQTA